MTASSSHTMTLPAILDITHAASFLEEAKHASAYESLTLDANAVERITTPCLQILLSLQATVEKAGGAVTYSSPSDAFTHAVATLGLTDHFTIHSQ